MTRSAFRVRQEQKDYLKAQPLWDWHQIGPKLEPLPVPGLALGGSLKSS